MNKIEKQLNDILNIEYLYNARQIKVSHYKIVQGNYVLYTTQGTKTLYESEVETFINALQPFKKKEVIVVSNNLPSTNNEVVIVNEQNEFVKQTLLDTLKKLKEDKAYIPQAKAICEVTSQWANIQRNETEIYKIVNKK
jgi:hypothetical protein